MPRAATGDVPGTALCPVAAQSATSRPDAIVLTDSWPSVEPSPEEPMTAEARAAVTVFESVGPGPGDSGVIAVPPGAGRTIAGLELVTLKLTGEQTRGSIGMIEGTSPPGVGPPRHIHRSSDELFYVLSGQFLFLAGELLTEAPPGSLIFIPRGTVHAVKALGSEPGKVLAAFVPGGPERAFEEFGRAPRDVVAEKYDSEFVGPPL